MNSIHDSLTSRAAAFNNKGDSAGENSSLLTEAAKVNNLKAKEGSAFMPSKGPVTAEQLGQALVWSEILGEPKCRRRRHRKV